MNSQSTRKETTPKLKQSVHKRLVFYIPGFDPMPPNRYREGYASEAKKQAEISGYQIDVRRISSLENVPRFEVKLDKEGISTKTEFRFLAWNDLVHEKMDIPVWQSWLAMFKIGRVVAGSGALRRLMKLHFPANITGCYPFILIPLQILIALLIGRLFGELAEYFLPVPFLDWALTFAVGYAIILWFRRLDSKILPYYVVHDVNYFCSENGYTPPTLRHRFNEMKSQLATAINRHDYDEILIVGHSSGAHMGVMIVAELIREGHLKRQDNVALLTLGQAIPMVSYLPKAHDLRLALYEMGKQTFVDWVDFTAPSDGVCFALKDPVACSVEVDYEQKYPKILSAAFSNTLSEAYQKRLKWRYFRIHFQYLCHFDKPGIYDYFQITAGPIRLWERYQDHPNSPSLSRINLNKFKDMKP